MPVAGGHVQKDDYPYLVGAVEHEDAEGPNCGNVVARSVGRAENEKLV